MSKPEFIERNAVLHELNYSGAICDFGKNLLENFPAADVVSVVRCKDCMHYSKNGCCCRPPNTDTVKRNPLDFCSYGVKEKTPMLFETTSKQRLSEILDSFFVEDGIHEVMYFTEAECETLTEYLHTNGVIAPTIHIGKSVWSRKLFADGVVREGTVVALTVDETGVTSFKVEFTSEAKTIDFKIKAIGETVFFTKDAANG